MQSKGNLYGATANIICTSTNSTRSPIKTPGAIVRMIQEYQRLKFQKKLRILRLEEILRYSLKKSVNNLTKEFQSKFS